MSGQVVCVCTHSLVLPIRCPPLSSSPHPTLSLRLGESFLLCVSPSCTAEAGGRTGAPSFFCSSPLCLPLIGHWCYACTVVFIASTCYSKELFLVFLSFALSAVWHPLLRSRFWAHRLERLDNTERKEEERWVEKGGRGGCAEHREVVPKVGFSLRSPLLNLYWFC